MITIFFVESTVDEILNISGVKRPTQYLFNFSIDDNILRKYVPFQNFGHVMSILQFGSHWGTERNYFTKEFTHFGLSLPNTQVLCVLRYLFHFFSSDSASLRECNIFICVKPKWPNFFEKENLQAGARVD